MRIQRPADSGYISEIKTQTARPTILHGIKADPENERPQELAIVKIAIVPPPEIYRRIFATFTVAHMVLRTGPHVQLLLACSGDSTALDRVIVKVWHS